jgi:hypothetical protein
MVKEGTEDIKLVLDLLPEDEPEGTVTLTFGGKGIGITKTRLAELIEA